MKISLLEDDDAQAQSLMQWLSDQQHQVERSANCRDFESKVASFLPDLIILDWELPDGTGFDMLKTLRNKHASTAPVLFTTQRDSEDDIVSALAAGADDYLTKPVREREFKARIAALSRRAGIEQAAGCTKEGPYTIDRDKKHVLLHTEIAKLTQKDFAVACCLFDNIGKALSREYLLKEVWGVNAGLDTRTVDVHVSRVRRSLKITPENGYIIKNIYQYGYRLEALGN